ncbi:hypothetical protein DMX10_05780 [Pseudomonas sp. 57B-090624]|nr:hypothetical protein DMX10_05780 [Pseudomonas sp. 57B-090624]
MVSINLLDGKLVTQVMRLLLTQGIEVEVLEVRGDSVRLAVRAPSGMLIVEELGFPS